MKQQNLKTRRYDDDLKNGLKNSNDTTKPTGEKLCEKLNSKLKKLNEADLKKGKEIVDEIYKDYTADTQKEWTRNLRNFRRAVKSTSNSGAKDCHGMSLKETKMFLSNNQFLRRFRDIAFQIFKLGHMPDIWKKDDIHFLYKQKGDRSDPSNWCPITIAPSLGKHIERLFSIIISPFDAFESIESELIAYVIDKVFQKEMHFDLGGFVRSYLKRESRVVDELTGALHKVVKIFLKKTAPQGSLLSPLF